MKILSVSLKNFASYEQLDFEFTRHGLTLVNGPTGSGKSTLCDVIPWVLFGRTAKDGAVDEVLSWPGDKITHGSILLDNDMNIVRIRGSKAKDNDLYFSMAPMQVIRGKDILDTQRLIEQHLGVNAATYLAGAYYHEFSQTAQFFTAAAKNRRQLCEQIVDLSLAKNLQTNVSTVRTTAMKVGAAHSTKLNELEATYRTTDSYLHSTVNKVLQWQKSQDLQIATVKLLSKDFTRSKKATLEELTKQFHRHERDTADQIQGIEDQIQENNKQIKPSEYFDAMLADLQCKKEALGLKVCPECGATKSHAVHDTVTSVKGEKAISLMLSKGVVKMQAEVSRLKATKNPYRQQIKDVTQSKNTYVQQLKALREEKNPHEASVLEINLSLGTIQADIDTTTAALVATKQHEDDLSLLLEIIADFRSELVKNTIVGLETQTNALLTEHFDAEIRVTFDVQDSDKLDVGITKDGNQCVYTQLSKGQRQLLKLAFGVAVMKQVANHNAFSPNAIFFDEALDSLDEITRAKCFKLLEKLATEYEGVFVVDHSEAFKSLFTNRYNVQLVDGNSILTKD